MNNWREEIVLHSHRIPWLIWIQLLVLFLLILLLSYLGLVSVNFAATVASSSSKISSAEVAQEVGGGSRETQTERARPARENNNNNTGTDETAGKKDLHHLLHPCYYLDLAKKAFLQCLGLGNAPSNPRERTHEE